MIGIETGVIPVSSDELRDFLTAREPYFLMGLQKEASDLEKRYGLVGYECVDDTLLFTGLGMCNHASQVIFDCLQENFGPTESIKMVNGLVTTTQDHSPACFYPFKIPRTFHHSRVKVMTEQGKFIIDGSSGQVTKSINRLFIASEQETEEFYNNSAIAYSVLDITSYKRANFRGFF